MKASSKENIAVRMTLAFVFGATASFGARAAADFIANAGESPTSHNSGANFSLNLDSRTCVDDFQCKGYEYCSRDPSGPDDPFGQCTLDVLRPFVDARWELEGLAA